jgi:hypothetical protein
VASKSDVIDHHFEAISTKATLLEIKRSKIERKVNNLQASISKPHVELNKLKDISWSGVP